ncbi:hypothetical protein DACRYDRAFT_23284 [Dacryopinax primogenitus]|uniref:Uncharacterized protein n=1 Tax=Dacryopinax primogenitus (strain DJM 731) TaxID=1858805 RepID=M5G9C4_DACPD|nr:uncharacterized protein DACRYDRAFT_23284 [Dacryopinax primogenitus]EJU00393.1 hypothetical protein DACRYDRAFT_23284 [Dacryopinax primogenitus]
MVVRGLGLWGNIVVLAYNPNGHQLLLRIPEDGYDTLYRLQDRRSMARRPSEEWNVLSYYVEEGAKVTAPMLDASEPCCRVNTDFMSADAARLADCDSVYGVDMKAKQSALGRLGFPNLAT